MKVSHEIYLHGPSGSGKSVVTEILSREGLAKKFRSKTVSTGDLFRALEEPGIGSVTAQGVFPESLSPIFIMLAAFMGAHVSSVTETGHSVAILDGVIRHPGQIPELVTLWRTAGVVFGLSNSGREQVHDAWHVAIKTPIPLVTQRLLDRGRRSFARAQKEVNPAEAKQIVGRIVDLIKDGFITKDGEGELRDLETQLSVLATNGKRTDLRLDQSLKEMGATSTPRGDDIVEGRVLRRTGYYARYDSVSNLWAPGGATEAVAEVGGFGFDRKSGMLTESRRNNGILVANDESVSLEELNGRAREVATSIFGQIARSRPRSSF